MKLNIDIKVPTSPEWVESVMRDFDSFLQDHADCERKASTMAMSFVAKYPDRIEIIPELIETAIEELEHFRDVWAIMRARGIPLRHKIPKDIYAQRLMSLCHSGRLERFRDRLLIASVVEIRGGERFKIVANHLEDVEMKKFYKRLWTSEAKHGHIFVKMALHYFDRDEVYERLDWWLDREAEIIQSMPITAALH